MLFLMFVLILVIGIVLHYVSHERYWCDKFLPMFITVLGCFAIFVSFIVMGFFYIGKDSDVAILNERYDMLTYQLENDIYDNDNDLGKRELMVDIQEWNESLACKQAMQDNFWVGLYMPDIYDQFEFIELEE